MTIPAGQRWIIDATKDLGYRLTDPGLCYGLAYVAAQAFLLGEHEIFTSRLEKIAETPKGTLQHKIADAKEKKKATFVKVKSELMGGKQELSKDEERALLPIIREKVEKQLLDDTDTLMYLDIEAFFDEVNLLFDPRAYQEVFPDDIIPSQNYALSFDLLKPYELEKRGGFKTVTSFSGCYQKQDLDTYFSKIRMMAQNAQYPISLVLRSSNHAIHVGFDVEKKQWFIADANRLDLLYLSDAEISNQVIEAFGKEGVPTNGVAIFNTAMHVSGDNIESAQALFETVKSDPEWINIHKVSSEKAKYKDAHGSFTLYIAAKNNDEKLLDDLLHVGADVNEKTSTGLTAMHVAANKGFDRIVEKLLDNHAEIVENQSGSTPLHIATVDAKYNVIELLLNRGAKIDAKCGPPAFCTALHMAVILEQVNIVSLLLRKGANPNLPAMGGELTINRAVQNNNEKIINALL